MSRRSANITKLFVYGTLKKDEPNHIFMEKAGCKFVTKAISIDKYPMVIATRYRIPYMLRQKGTGNNIRGEIYDVDEVGLAFMDKFEVCPVIYNRETISVCPYNDGDGGEEIDASRSIEVQCYLLPNFPPHLLTFPFLSEYHEAACSRRYVGKGKREVQICVENLQELLTDE